jgi:hypothetical protein
MESQAASGFRLRHRRRRSRPQTQQSVESRRRYSELSLRFRFHHRATTQEPRSRRLAVPAVRSQSRFEGGRFSELRETSMPLATDMQSRVAAMMQRGGVPSRACTASPAEARRLLSGGGGSGSPADKELAAAVGARAVELQRVSLPPAWTGARGGSMT